MIYVEFSYKCAGCGVRFRSLELPGGAYGEFLLRNKRGDMPYLKALNCDEFDFVDSVLVSNPKLAKLDDYDRANLLHGIFGYCCDPAPDGGEFMIDQMPCCPNCNSLDMASWGVAQPLVRVDVDIKPVTFEKWHKLTESEKTKRIDEVVDNFYLRKGS